MKQLRTFLIAGFTVLGCGVAQAFWSATGFKVHQDITSDRLNQAIYVYSGNAGYSFSPTAIDAINQAHTIADSDPYDARDHFDSEHLTDGFALLLIHRQSLMAELAKPSPSSTVAWTTFGLALHQIQDFYAHSSYVEHTGGTGGIIDFGKATKAAAGPNGAPPAYIQSPSAIGTVCASDFKTLLTPTTSQVTTGYYPPWLGPGAAPTPATQPPSGKCAHGGINGSFVASTSSTVVASATSCAKTAFTGTVVKDGINKDHACVTSQADKTNFIAARLLALEETQAFTESIVADLAANGNITGFCVLLGLPLNAAPCNSPGNTGNPQTFVQYTIDSVSFGPYDPCASATGDVCTAGNVGTGPTAYINITYGAQGNSAPSSGASYAYFSAVINNPTQLITLGSNTSGVAIQKLAGPQLTYSFSTNTDDIGGVDPSTLSYLNVGFYTTKVASSPPEGYPAYAFLWSNSNLARNPTQQPGSLTIQLEALPIVPTPTVPSGSITPVANIYAQGSFSAAVADPVASGSINIGAHKVQGTFLINTGGQCTSMDGQTMSCQ